VKKVFAYTNGGNGIVEQLPLQRSWMDATFSRHAYHCFPVSISNRLGWGLSFPEDISFIWDGITDERDSHVKILSGDQYANSRRGSATVSFETDMTFVGENGENLTLLTMPVPNQFIRGAQCMTTTLSTSVLAGDLPIAWMITEPNIVITIPAYTPIAAIIPISLTDIQDHELEITKGGRPTFETEEFMEKMKGRAEASMQLNSKGEWTHFYRDAVWPDGAPAGKHEAKKIVMKINYIAKN
jgi:hypothetical protein